MKKLNFFVLVCCLLSFVVGCSESFYSKEKANDYLLKMHQQYNQKNFSWIYQDASHGFREGVREDEFVKVLGKISDILGSSIESEFVDAWQSKTIHGDLLEVYRFKTKFEKGVGVEIIQIILDKSTATPKLFRYDLNSDELYRHMLLNSK